MFDNFDDASILRGLRIIRGLIIGVGCVIGIILFIVGINIDAGRLISLAFFLQLASIMLAFLFTPEAMGWFPQTQRERFDRDITIAEKKVRARKIQSDEFGSLYEPLDNSRNLLLLQVIDGTGEHWVNVPGNMRTAKQAVAWSYGLDSKAYNPKVRT